MKFMSWVEPGLGAKDIGNGLDIGWIRVDHSP